MEIGICNKDQKLLAMICYTAFVVVVVVVVVVTYTGCFG